jgi:hypothetical protein
LQVYGFVIMCVLLAAQVLVGVFVVMKGPRELLEGLSAALR